ncbi:MAG: hypothetical protein ACT4QA_21815 [Panacagrimonas sp.]
MAAVKLAILEPQDVVGRKFDVLVFAVLSACYAAAHFRDDEGKAYRARLAQLRQERKHIAKTFIEAGKLIRRYPELMWAWPLDRRFIRTADHKKVEKLPNDAAVFAELVNRKNRQRPNLMDVFADTLTAFGRNVRKPMPQVDGGPFMHDFTFACLHFDNRMTAKKTPDVATALAFHLGYLFRRWCAGIDPFTFSYGPWPRSGNTHLACVAALAVAALSTPMSEATVRRRLDNLVTNHPGVILRPWPNNETPCAVPLHLWKNRIPGRVVNQCRRVANQLPPDLSNKSASVVAS